MTDVLSGNKPKRRREEGSQTDEDLSGHCCDSSLAEQVAEINSKLDKLLNVVSEFDSMKTRLTELEEQNRTLKEASENTANEISNLKTTSVYTFANMDATTRELNNLKEEVEILKRRNIKLEAYTRRENMKIFGIKESAGETNEKTEELVRTMLTEKMKIPSDCVDDIRFERVHRMTTRQDRVNSTKPRGIIVKFSFYQDKEYVWSFVRNLKDSGIGIANDFPREIDKIHEKLYPVLKSAKRAKQRAYFKVDKLIINGQVYRGEETKHLVHYGLIMNSTWADGGLQQQGTPNE